MRHKTKYTGVFYRHLERNGDKSYYIVYKKGGRIIEEQVGRQTHDRMTPLKAADIRNKRIKNNPTIPAAKKQADRTGFLKEKNTGTKEKNKSIKAQVSKLAQGIRERISLENDVSHPIEITQMMLEYANDAVYISQDGITRFVNSKTEKITGYSFTELVGKSSFNLTHPEDLKIIRDRYLKRFRGEEVPDLFPHRIIDKNKDVKWIEVSTVMITWEEQPAQLNFMRDITKRKTDEQALKAMNTALDTLLKKRENDIRQSEEKIMRNIKELILPYVAKLKTTNLDFSQAVDIDIIEKHLTDITSPYLSRLPSGYTQFSPREMQVTTMIKNGLTTKEIARALTVSSNAIDIYRQKIRKKLGLNNKKINLRSFLISLGEE